LGVSVKLDFAMKASKAPLPVLGRPKVFGSVLNILTRCSNFSVNLPRNFYQIVQPNEIVSPENFHAVEIDRVIHTTVARTGHLIKFGSSSESSLLP
jgi:hypothetical protein